MLLRAAALSGLPANPEPDIGIQSTLMAAVSGAEWATFGHGHITYQNVGQTDLFRLPG